MFNLLKDVISVTLLPVSSSEADDKILELWICIVNLVGRLDQTTAWNLLGSLIQTIIKEGSVGYFPLVKEAFAAFTNYKQLIAHLLIQRMASEEQEDVLAAGLPLIAKALRPVADSTSLAMCASVRDSLLHRLVLHSITDELLRGIVEFHSIFKGHTSPHTLQAALVAAKDHLTRQQLDIVSPWIINDLANGPSGEGNNLHRILQQLAGSMSEDPQTADLIKKLCTCRFPRKFASLLDQFCSRIKFRRE
jgi:hypothetical protein